MQSILLGYILSLAAIGATVGLTLQRLKYVWQSRILATLMPLAGILLAQTGNVTVDLILCGLVLWATIRAIQILLPVEESIRDFVAKMRPGGNRGLAVHLMHYVSLKIASIVLLFKHASGDAAAEEAIRAQRVIARDGALEAQRAIPSALGFSRVHWIAVAEIFSVWLLLELAHLATPTATFALAVPVVLLTAAYMLYRKAPDFGPPAPPHTYSGIETI